MRGRRLTPREVGERFLLVLGGHLLIGLDLGDLRLDAVRCRQFLVAGIDPASTGWTLSTTLLYSS